jgi:hypothetical protein
VTDGAKLYPTVPKLDSKVLILLVLYTTVAACTRKAPGDSPRAEYDPRTGRLSRLSFDLNKNGKNDSVSYMDGTRILRVELDLDENGKTERWDFYKPDGALDKVGFASKDDGVMDSEAFYTADGQLQRIEISTKRNGRFDRVEFYERNVLTQSQDDTNGDGKPDKWDFYTPRREHAAGEPAYAITATEFDDSKSGHPERRFTYAANGAVARVDVDPQGTGAWVPMRVTPAARLASR